MTDRTPDQEVTRAIAELDRTIHEPARLMILAILYIARSADFVFIQRQTGLVGGNLSSHMSRLEDAGYVQVEKTFVDRTPRTLYHLTETGRAAFQQYRQGLLQILSSLPET